MTHRGVVDIRDGPATEDPLPLAPFAEVTQDECVEAAMAAWRPEQHAPGREPPRAAVAACEEQGRKTLHLHLPVCEPGA